MYTINITNKCAVTSIVSVPIDDKIYYHGRDPIDIKFQWSETVGTCGPIRYSARVYDSADQSYNETLDPIVFLYPFVVNDIQDELRIYTWDETKFGSYDVRVWASLGVGGYVQTFTTFNLQVIKDPCSYYTYVTPLVEDLTLWINQTDQIVLIPPYTMSDPLWSCNFTYEIRA